MKTNYCDDDESHAAEWLTPILESLEVDAAAAAIVLAAAGITSCTTGALRSDWQSNNYSIVARLHSAAHAALDGAIEDGEDFRAALHVKIGMALGKGEGDAKRARTDADALSVAEADVRAGGPRLRPLTVSSEADFGAAVMIAVPKGLMAMTVDDLKRELEARDELKSGNKAWLRRRLHAAILRARLRAGRAQREQFFGSDSDDDDLM